MPVAPLPSNPNLDYLKHEAKDLLKAHAAHSPQFAHLIREFHPRFSKSTDSEIFAAPFKLSDAQLTVARRHGFASWPRMKKRIEKPVLADRLDLPHHERIEDSQFRHAVDLIDAGEVEGLRAYLKRHPDLAHQHVDLEGTNYFCHPTLLEFIAENPTRRGSLPKNIVEVARALLDAGTTQAALNATLELVASSLVARQSGTQSALVKLLCDRGADPKHAMRVAAIHGEFDAVRALLHTGAKLDLPIAAALGHIDDVDRLLPLADADDRRWALAIASQFGYVEIVRALLDAGEDPSRYNPLGGHSHGTPLHQAAGYGHLELVRLLVERGARLDLRDTLWNATPAEWAHHEGRTEVERYLRAQEKT